MSDYATELVAYVAYLNAPRGVLDATEQMLLEEDTAKAKAAMERAYLELQPTLPAGGALTAGPREPPLPWPGFDPEVGFTTTSPGGW